MKLVVPNKELTEHEEYKTNSDPRIINSFGKQSLILTHIIYKKAPRQSN